METLGGFNSIDLENFDECDAAEEEEKEKERKKPSEQRHEELTAAGLAGIEGWDQFQKATKLNLFSPQTKE